MITMTFEKGVPTSINGQQMKVSEIIMKLNELGAKHGIGICDIVEEPCCRYEIPWCI